MAASQALTPEKAETELFNDSVQRLVAAALGAQDGTLIISGESDAAKRLVRTAIPGTAPVRWACSSVLLVPCSLG